MKIIRDYILKEIFPPFLLSLFISTVILTASNVIQMADMIINKGVDFMLMAELIGLLMPSLLTFTIPMSLLSAVLLAFSRFTCDNEIIALRASGISLVKVAFPILIIGMLFSLACVPLNYDVTPESGYRARKLLKEIGIRNPAAIIEPGIFLNKFENFVLFVYDMKGNKLKNVKIFQPQENGPTRTLSAERGEIISRPNENYIKIKLINGTADEVNPSDPNTFMKLAFKNYHITLRLKESLRGKKVDKKTREFTYRELRDELEKNRNQKKDTTAVLIEIHNKMALAFSNFIFALIAIPIGLKTHRREKTINFGMALLIFLLYWGAMLGGVAFAIRKLVPPWFGVWMPNMIFGVAAIILFTRINRQ